MLDLGTLKTNIKVEGAQAAKSELTATKTKIRELEDAILELKKVEDPTEKQRQNLKQLQQELTETRTHYRRQKEDIKDLETTNASATSNMKSQWSSFKSTFVGMALVQIFAELAQAITSCVDAAIERVDTLNRFPKVMESLGYSADEAAASIDKISESIEGMPTTLDDAVGGVQRLTAATGDLQLSTDLWAGLNDMVYANGASTEKASSAMEQLTQMISAQKVDATAWRSVMEACPGAVNQLAQSMLGATASANDLYDGLQSGTVSFDEFYKAVIQLDTEGAPGIISFAEQAENAVGGIGTAMDNASNAITKNLGKIVDELNKNGEIEDFFKDLKRVINNIGDSIVAVLPYIKSFLKVLEPLAPVIAGIVAAWTAYKLATLAAAAAQAVLNAAMNANAVGKIILAVVGLISAIVYLWNTNEDFRNAVIEIWTSISEFIGAFVDAIIEFFTVTIPEAFNSFCAFVGEIWAAITDIFNSFFEWVSGLIDGFVSFFTDTIPNAFNSFLEFISGLWESIKSVFRNGVDNVISFVESIPDRIISFFSNAGTWLIDAGRNVLQGLWDGIESGLGWLGDKLGSIGDFIVEHKGPPKKDRKLLTNNGKLIMQSLVDGITNVKPLDNALKGISNYIANYDMGNLTLGTTAAAYAGAYSSPSVGDNTTQYYSFGDINITASDVSDVSTIEDFVSMLRKAKNVNPTRTGW